MRWVGLVGGFVFLLACGVAAFAEIPEANPDDLRGIYKSLSGGPKSLEPMRETKTANGYLRFLAAPDGAVFKALPPGPAVPEQAAEEFVRKHRRAFGAVSARSTFKPSATNPENGRASVSLHQEYAGVPVYGARVFVQTDTQGGVLSVLSDIMRETTVLDNNTVTTTPTVTLDRAKAEAVDVMRTTYGGAGFDALGGKLFVFSPPVVGDSGDPCLVWGIVVESRTDARAKEVILIDAHTLEVRLRHPVIPHALDRQVYDSGNTYSDPGSLARSEGQPASPVDDVNRAYDYLGDTYNFYMDHHGRDSIDDNGMPLSVTVRFCYPSMGCPMLNAFYDGSNDRMYYGAGMVSDDVVAHEYTHGVTFYTSNLAYYYESGAINESFSDIWGEYVDLTNGRGDDSPEVRWLIGEDTIIGAFRNMADPPQFGDPAIYHGPYWYYGAGDYGGVHTNNGVGNKLCYLLTDGDTFNGQVVSGIGIAKAADIFYRVQAVLLPSSGDTFWERALYPTYIDYIDYGELLVQSVQDLAALEPARFGIEDIRAVKAAAYAVEILEFQGEPLKNVRAMSVENEPAVALTWTNPDYPYFDQVLVVRNANQPPTNMYDGEVIYNGTGNWAVDEPLQLGRTYYYAVFAIFNDGEPVQMRHAAAQVGSNALPVAYETFWSGADLGYKQLLFSPVGPAASGGYDVTLKSGIRELPHTSAGAMYVPLIEDSSVNWTFRQPFPFMGEYRRHCWIAENGYVSFGESAVPRYSYLNFPSGNSANAIPRICAAFADLSNVSGGSIWGKSLPDRSVLTYEKVPEWGRYYYTNTVQLELFYSGHIRITFLELTASDIVVGLADGQGVFYDPELLIQSGIRVPKIIDLSSFPDGSRRVSLEPIGPVSVNEGMVAQFEIVAHAPGGNPNITVENMPQGATLTSVSPTRSVFSWQTGYADAGERTVLVKARESGQVASQEVSIRVGRTLRAPTVSNVVVSPESPAAGTPLGVSYALHSPEDDGLHYVQIEWYRNGTLMIPLFNAETTPGFVANYGDTWHAIVTPYSIVGRRAVVGEPVASNVVRVAPWQGGGGTSPSINPTKFADVNGDGVVDAIDVQLVINGVLGTQFVPTADVNRDGVKNAIDIQLVVNGVLGKY